MNSYPNEDDAFLRNIATGDEMWIHHYAPESKRQSMECKHPISPLKKKERLNTQPSAR
jgi:hypothetical protein